MIREVVELQDTFNSLVDMDWKYKQYKWLRYVWVECAELMESLDFKHWKKQNIDWDNVQVELIDIFHFLLSDSIISFGKERTIDIIYNAINQVYIRLENEEAFRKMVDNIAYYATNILYNGEFNVNYYNKMFVFLFILWDSVSLLGNKEYVSIFKYYIVKNALNKFRQDNGYKFGNYKKNWDGLEDNVYAFKFANKFKGVNGLYDYVYSKLEKEYRKYK